MARGATPGAGVAAPQDTPPCLAFHVVLPGDLPYDSCMGTCRETNHSFAINRGEELSHKHTPHKSHSPSPLVFFSTIFIIRSLAKLIIGDQEHREDIWYDQYKVLHSNSCHVLHLVLALILSMLL